MPIIICLGNAYPRALANNPKPPRMGDMSLEAIEQWASDVCQINIAGIPQIGEMIKDSDGNDAYQVTADHRRELLIQAIDQPFEVHWGGGKSRTVFELPVLDNGEPQDSLSEMLATIKRNWPIHSKSSPGWVSGTDDFLVMAVKRELGIPEVREWLPQGECGDINYHPHGA